MAGCLCETFKVIFFFLDSILIFESQKKQSLEISLALWCVCVAACYLSRAITRRVFNPLNAELNPIRHLLALVGARHIVHVSRVRVKEQYRY